MKLKEFFNLGFYTSRLDQFLTELAHRFEPTPSQLVEIKKYDRISELRDRAAHAEKQKKHWDNF